jgi:hypothetical protein
VLGINLKGKVDEMNKQNEFNLKHWEVAYQVMLDVQNSGAEIFMGSWQRRDIFGETQTQPKNPECGMVCCFGGYLALSPKFHELGGSVHPANGAPNYVGLTDGDAVARFLGISHADANMLVFPGEYHDKYYGNKHINDIAVTDVLKALEQIKQEYTS